MKDYHLSIGWSDIGQHLTLFPDGIWVLGRDLNKTPSSILGWNTGAICIEMLGNFDKGNDVLEGAQYDAVCEFAEYMVEQKGLAMKFHRDSPTAYKTCPGTGIDRAKFFDDVSTFTERRVARQNALDVEERKKSIARIQELQEIMRRFNTMFKDMVNAKGEPHWSNEFVNFLVEKKIIKGQQDTDGQYIFRPNDPITRAEVATVLAKTYESLQELIETYAKLK